MAMKWYKLYGKDKPKQKWQLITARKGKSKTSAIRTFKKRSGWPMVKAKEEK